MAILISLLVNLILALTLSTAPVPVKDEVLTCEYEDGSGDKLPCYWNAQTSGNEEGLSYWILSDETTFYDEPGIEDGYVTPDEKVICPKGWDRPLYSLDGYSWSTCIDGGVGEGL